MASHDVDAWRVGNKNSLRHGASAGGRVTPEYTAWKGMRQRCYLPSNQRYALYGGRGIKVHPAWDQSFEAFLRDVGRRPGPGYSLDRIDSDGDYVPGNVRWATQREQCRNQRRNRVVEFKGEQVTLAEVAQRTGLERTHIRYYLDQGRTADEAVAVILSRR